jgi:ABC-type enterochelin transport system permease subunit
LKKLKHFLLQLPEYLLIAALLFYWIGEGKLLNPMIIGLIALLILQVLIQNRVIGLLIPSILGLSCLYMLFALISEFREFPAYTADAQEFLFVGLGLFLLGMLVSGVMIYKYFPHSSKV